MIYFCHGKTCNGKGKCVVGDNDYSCNCNPGWLGKDCEKQDFCVGKTCSGKGKCVSGDNGYTCTCDEGRTGKDCETIVTTSTVESSTSSVKETTRTEIASTGTSSIVQSSTSFVKDTTATEIPSTVPEVHPCHKDVDPCGEHGFCEENGKDYKCKCNVGYTGDNCTSIEWCVNNKQSVCGETDCKFDKFTKSGYCDCGNNKTVFFNAKKKICEVIDACSMKKAKGECRKPHEKCNNGECECEPNYKYDDKKDCVADFCGLSSGRNPCGPYSNCTEVGDGTYKCVCHKGYTWEGRECKYVNPCSPGISNCEQKCDNGTCDCYQGYKLNDDKKTCKLDSGKTECKKDCGAGKCIEDKCVCPEISHVPHNGTCLDRCTAEQFLDNTCPRGIGCIVDKKFGFICNCTGLYKWANDGVHCEKRNMCTEGDGIAECKKENALCQSDPRYPKEFKCVCQDGYEKENNICTHKCLVKKKAKECVDMLGICELNSAHEAVCKCRPLMEQGTSGKCDRLARNSFTGNFMVQRRTYEISSAVSGRSKRSEKTIDYTRLKDDFSDSLYGVYPEDYSKSNVLNCRDAGSDLNCTVELQLNKKVTPERLRIITARTVCLPIDGNKDHCLIQPNLIVKQSSEEVFEATDPCIEEIRNKVCGSATNCSKTEGNDVKCACSEGFKPIGSYYPDLDKKMLIENCEDVNECKNASSCPSSTDCVNIHGSYLCTCKNGYRKNSTDTDTKKEGCIAVCDPNPCQHGTCHQTGQHGFACSCEKYYTGFLCTDYNKENGHKVASIVGGVLGAALALTLIIGFVLYRRMQKKTEDDNDEYSRRRKQGILSNMGQGRFGRKEQNHDIEVSPLDRRGSGDYRREYRESELAIPRPHVGGGRQLQDKRESGDYRRGYAGDDRMFPKASSSRHSDEDDRSRQTRDPQSGRRPLSRSTDQLNGGERKSSVVQYRNRGFEED